MKKLDFIIVAFALLFASCTIHMGEKGEDSTKIIKAYDLTDFYGITLIGSGDIEFTQDSVYKVEVEASEGVISRMEISVEDGNLNITPDSDAKEKNSKVFVMKSGKYAVRISAPTLRSVLIVGSGDFDCEKPLTTDSFSLQVVGSGDICFNSITASNITASVVGSGDIDFTAKDVETTDIRIAGSGDVTANLNSCGVVKVAVDGSGDITLKGDVRSLKKEKGDIDTSGLKIKEQ